MTVAVRFSRPSLLGMTEARRRMMRAGYQYEADARRQLQIAERERQASLAQQQAEVLDALLTAMHGVSAVTGKKRRPRAIIKAVADKHGLTPADITGPSRVARLVLARQEAVWMVKQATNWSLPEIGRHFGNRDHTTILHSIRKHQARLDAEGAVA